MKHSCCQDISVSLNIYFQRVKHCSRFYYFLLQIKMPKRKSKACGKSPKKPKNKEPKITRVILFFPDSDDNEGENFSAFHISSGFKFSPGHEPSFQIDKPLKLEHRRKRLIVNLPCGPSNCHVFARIEEGKFF